jgi:D-xylose reductase
VRDAVLRSLKSLQVDYLDLYLIHWPFALKYAPIEDIAPIPWLTKHNDKMELDYGVTYQQTWEAMETLVNEGLVRSIGVSNVNCNKLHDLMCYAKIKPAILQNEMSPFLASETQLEYAHSLGIQVMAYSQFGDLSTSKTA